MFDILWTTVMLPGLVAGGLLVLASLVGRVRPEWAAAGVPLAMGLGFFAGYGAILGFPTLAPIPPDGTWLDVIANTRAQHWIAWTALAWGWGGFIAWLRPPPPGQPDAQWSWFLPIIAAAVGGALMLSGPSVHGGGTWGEWILAAVGMGILSFVIAAIQTVLFGARDHSPFVPLIARSETPVSSPPEPVDIEPVALVWDRRVEASPWAWVNLLAGGTALSMALLLSGAASTAQLAGALTAIAGAGWLLSITPRRWRMSPRIRANSPVFPGIWTTTAILLGAHGYFLAEMPGVTATCLIAAFIITIYQYFHWRKIAGTLSAGTPLRVVRRLHGYSWAMAMIPSAILWAFGLAWAARIYFNMNSGSDDY